MSDQTSTPVVTDLVTRFPEWVKLDARPGFQGYLVDPAHLLECAQVVRDEMGYDYLSSVTAVDYYPEAKMEVVYHAYKTTGGPALIFRTQTTRTDSVVPSLVSIYP